MSLLPLLLTNLAIVLGLMFCLWVISLPIKNASIVDIFWGIGFVVIAWSSVALAGAGPWRAIALSLAVTLWGLRLAGYLAWRNSGKGEDHRYAEMRERRPGRFWIWSLPAVFLLQGLLMWLVALPLQVTPLSGQPLGGLDVLGFALWATGWLFESVGDWQLARFKAQPENRGRVLQQGLWRYTRHPNYFGDFLVWWGFFLLAAGAGAWWTVISPLVMSLLLVRVSGVALLEKSISQRRPEYADYIRRTSAFIPWPPREKG